MSKAVLLESNRQCASPWVRIGEARKIVVEGTSRGDLLDFIFRDSHGERIQGVLSTHEDGPLEVKEGAAYLKARHVSAGPESSVTVDLE